MTLNKNLFNSQLRKSNLSPNLHYTEKYEHQNNFNLLDEYPEVEVTSKTEYAPLPSRWSLFKRKKMDLIVNPKNLVEKCYTIKADEQFVSNVNEQVKTLISTVTIPLEGENDALVERPERPTRATVTRNLKTCLRKRKHKYTCRVGSRAEMMRQYYKAMIFITKNFSITSTNSSKRPCVMKFQTSQEFLISRRERYFRNKARDNQ